MLKTSQSESMETVEATQERSRRFEQMVTEHRKRAYSMALQLTRNPVEAEDLMQVTFVKAWRGFDGYMPGRPFLNWLLRIMQRAYLDSRRRHNPIRRAESLNSMISPSDGEVQELPIADTSRGPEDLILQEELGRELSAALHELPDVYREAIELCDLHDLSYADIAEHQGTTIGTVRSRIHRGRKMLREIILRRGIAVR